MSRGFQRLGVPKPGIGGALQGDFETGDPARRRGRHDFSDPDRGAPEVDPVPLCVNPHHREHTGTQRGGHQIGRGKTLAPSLIVHGGIRANHRPRRSVRGLHPQVALILHSDLDHGFSFGIFRLLANET